MSAQICVSTPSRLCLFGEHQDFLGLSVIAVAIDLRFSAQVTPRDDKVIRIIIRDESLDFLNVQNDKALYQEYEVDFSKPLTYRNDEDFYPSTVNTLLKNGYDLRGFDIKMDSQIPIGKGMCSSSTMIVALIKAILEGIGHPDAKDPMKIALLAFQAEVEEFGNPGGKMDHMASALGGLVHLDFANGDTKARSLNHTFAGRFILFDSLERKDTLRVLASSKTPTLAGLDLLKEQGVKSIADFVDGDADPALADTLPPAYAKAVKANIEDYRIFKEGLALIESGKMDDAKLGELLSAHQAQLRDGLGISTDTIEWILETAKAAGAYGGKLNGSGGGGCCYVYAPVEKCDAILEAVGKRGYPGKVLKQDTGVRLD
ncbi:MAG: hypothetical protein IJC88_03885 [Oscillospiraceae bacterium]|nr:hypothetical protein [Oscillospiraceae bacterium]